MDRFFRRANGDDLPPDGGVASSNETDAAAAIARSQRAPHGPVVARVASLDALEVGRACIGVGAGRERMGEALSLGSGVLLHKKMGDSLRQGDVLFTMFAEVGGTGGDSEVPRRVITPTDVDASAARIIGAYGFAKPGATASPPPLVRCFIDRDGSVQRALP